MTISENSPVNDIYLFYCFLFVLSDAIMQFQVVII